MLLTNYYYQQTPVESLYDPFSFWDLSIYGIILFAFIFFLIYLLPAIIIASAIKKSISNNIHNSYIIADALKKLAPRDPVPVFFPLVEELTYYFDLGDNIFVPKCYYNSDEDYYDTPVGAFVPMYEEDNKTIMGFLYKK